MKKLLVLFAISFAVSIVSYGQLEDPPTEPSDRDWEVAPNIIAGGYSVQEGAYVYRLCNTFTCPTLVNDRRWYYVQYLQGIAGNVGYGEFKHHGGGSLISYDNQGEITKADDETWAVSYSHSYVTDHSPESSPRYPVEFTGSYGPAYVYKKENIQPMSIVFSSESYTAQEGQKLSVNVFVIGGSGHYSGKTVKPTFLSTVGKLAYEGTCYDPVQTSISTIVTDTVTGQQCAASVDIIITEKVDTPDENPNAPSNPSNPSDPSDPSNPSNPSNPSDPSEPTDPSNQDSPDSPDSPDNPSEPSDPDEPDSPEEPTKPDTPDTPNEPTDPSNPDSPEEPNDPSEPNNPNSPDSPDDPINPNEPVIVVPDPVIPDEPVVIPDNPDTPDEPEDSEPADESDDVIIITPEVPENNNEEPVFVVIDDYNETSEGDKIIVTDDGVTTVRKDNHDLAVFLGMFGAVTALTGSAAVPERAPMAVQEAREGKSHE